MAGRVSRQKNTPKSEVPRQSTVDTFNILGNPAPKIPTGMGEVCTCKGRQEHHHGEYAHLSHRVRMGRLPGDAFSKLRLAEIPVDDDNGQPIEGVVFFERTKTSRGSIVPDAGLPSDGAMLKSASVIDRDKARARKRSAA